MDNENPVYDYSAIVRRPVRPLPEGKRLAVWMAMNVEHYRFGMPAVSLAGFTAQLNPDPLNQGWRDYGPRVGVWRLMEIMDRFELPVSGVVNSEAVRRYPEIVEEGRARGWCWVGHGENNSEYPVNLSREAERDYIKRVTETIADATGSRPRGWLGPALTESASTNELLLELGYTYSLNWAVDDEPFALRGGLLSVPYSSEVNDLPAFVLSGHSGPEFRDMLIDQFDQLLEDGEQRPRVMGVGLHPFLLGQPYRARHLSAALAHMTAHRDDVWFATSDEIADWYRPTPA